MTRSPTIATAPDDQPVIRMERLIDAGRAAVFGAWEDPEALKHWWGPDGFTITILERTFAVGGVFRFIMHAPNGMNFANRVVYKEIVRNERLAYSHGADIDDPDTFQVEVTFADAGPGKTLITITTTFHSMERRAAVMSFGAVELGKQTWDKLAAWAEGRA
jgi:uncharacterized protein YndB with AHSA1/START domain